MNTKFCRLFAILALAIAATSSLAAGGRGARPGYGASAYAPGQGPTGASAWNGGSWSGYANARFVGGGGRRLGYGGRPVNAIVVPAPTPQPRVYVTAPRPQSAGFYGGGGVFYSDNGYRSAAPVPYGAPSQHVIYLPDSEPSGAK